MIRKRRRQSNGGSTFPITYNLHSHLADNAIGNGDRRHC